MKKLREYKGVTYDQSVEAFRYDGTRFDRAADVIARGYRLTDDDHAALMGLKANPWEQERVPMLESLLDGMTREIDGYQSEDEVAFYVKDFAATLRAAFPQIDGESTLLANYFGMCEERNEYRDKLAHMTAAEHIKALEAMGAVCDSVKMLVGDNGSVSIGARVLILPPEMRDAR